MSDPIVRARRGDGPIDVTVAEPNAPHNVTGVVWRYDANENPLGLAGEFSRTSPTVTLGNLPKVEGQFFLVEGVVIEQGDNPPVLYKVMVTVSQGGRVLHEEVPPSGGSGEIGTADQAFSYIFQVREVTP